MKYVSRFASLVFVLGALTLFLHAHPVFAQSPAGVVITSGGSTNPVIVANYPSDPSVGSDRSVVFTSVITSESGCVREPFNIPSATGIVVTTDQSGAGATALPFTGTLVETVNVQFLPGAQPEGFYGINYIVDCTGYTNADTGLFGRQASLDFEIDHSKADRLASVVVPSTGSATLQYSVSAVPEGTASGCQFTALNPAGNSAGVGIAVNTAWSSTQNIAATGSQSPLTLTFSPGALASHFALVVSASCSVGSNPITPIYHIVIDLSNGNPVRVYEANPDGSITTGGTTVTLPTVGTYTGVFNMNYDHTNAQNCVRLAVTPPANVTLSSSSTTTDSVMEQNQDITDVFSQDVTVTLTNPEAPLTVTIPITIACTGAADTFVITLQRTQTPPATQIVAMYNGQTSQNNLLTATDLINIGSGQVSIPFEIDGTVPAGASNCYLYREDLTKGTYKTGQGPQAPPATFYGTDNNNTFAGTLINGTGTGSFSDSNFIVTFSPSDLPAGQIMLWQEAVECTSNPSYYAYVDIAFARYPSVAVGVGATCINGVTTISYSNPPTATPTATPTPTTSPTTSPTASPTQPSPTITVSTGGLNDILPDTSGFFLGALGSSSGSSGVGGNPAQPVTNNPTLYEPTPPTVTAPTPPIYTTDPILIGTTPCVSVGSTNEPTPTPTSSQSSSPTATPTAGSGTDTWNDGVGSKLTGN